MQNFVIFLKKNKITQSILCLVRILYFLPYLFISKKLHLNIMDPQATVNSILNKKLSVARFGDGEFNIAFNKKGIGFQEYDRNLSSDLKKVLRNNNKKFELALPHGFEKTSIDKFRVKTFWWSYVSRNYKNILFFAVESGRRNFLDTNFTRVITEISNKNTINEVLSDIRNIWKNKRVLIVEGEGTGFGVGNDLLDQAKSVHRIIAPAKNAYSRIRLIRSAVNEYISNSDGLDDVVVLFALGPTATVLASEFSSTVQSIDIGHFDLQYEYLQKGSYKKVAVDNKYDNEAINGDNYDIEGRDYQSEIIKSIT